MWLQLTTMLAEQAKRPGESEPPWMKVILPLILMIAYALSALLKNRSKKPPSSQPRPMQGPGSAAPSAPRSQTNQRVVQPGPPRAAERTAPRPTAAPAARPVQAVARRPAQQAQPAQRKQVVPAATGRLPVPTAPRGQRRPVARSLAESAALSAKAQQQMTSTSSAESAALPVKAQQQMTSTREAARLRQQSGRAAGQPQAAPAQRPKKAADRLNLALGQRHDWARAIVLAEILGRPVGLREGPSAHA